MCYKNQTTNPYVFYIYQMKVKACTHHVIFSTSFLVCLRFSASLDYTIPNPFKKLIFLFKKFNLATFENVLIKCNNVY